MAFNEGRDDRAWGIDKNLEGDVGDSSQAGRSCNVVQNVTAAPAGAVKNNITSLKTSGVPPASTINNSSFCIDGFLMILSVNSDYFLKQRFPVDLCNGEVLCFLCGTD
jgi:hypothetical protein